MGVEQEYLDHKDKSGKLSCTGAVIKRSERPEVGLKSAAACKCGEHHRPDIGLPNSFIDDFKEARWLM
jgi:hypothetical protein